MDSEVLKACPFCGKRAAVIATRPVNKKWIEYPLCEYCGAECETVEQWNTRPLEDALRAENKLTHDLFWKVTDAISDAQEKYDSGENTSLAYLLEKLKIIASE